MNRMTSVPVHVINIEVIAMAGMTVTVIQTQTGVSTFLTIDTKEG